MKKFIICGLIAFSAMATTLTSCGKYDDGPSVSLLTKKSRIVNTWSIEKYTATTASGSSTDLTSFVSDYSIEFKKDGTYTIIWGSTTESGTWVLSDNKEDIITTSSAANSSPSTDHILKLKSKEMWTKYTYSNGDYDEIHYKQK